MTGENGNMYMPVAPAYGGYGNDMFGNNGAWWIIMLLIFFGWGNGNLGGNMNGGVGSEVQRGFDQNAVMNGFAGVQNAIANGFQNNTNQQFAIQSAMQGGFCDNRAGLADLKFTVATEACADRNAITSALRDVLEANNASTQRILDQMCQDKIDAKNELIANLRQQLQMAQLAASQGAQTSAIIANNEAQTAALERYLAPTPVPAYVVQNPNCCQQNCTCGG